MVKSIQLLACRTRLAGGWLINSVSFTLQHAVPNVQLLKPRPVWEQRGNILLKLETAIRNLDEVVKIFRRNDWMEVVKESSFARCMKADLEIGCDAVSEAETPSCSYVVLLR